MCITNILTASRNKSPEVLQTFNISVFSQVSVQEELKHLYLILRIISAVLCLIYVFIICLLLITIILTVVTFYLNHEVSNKLCLLLSKLGMSSPLCIWCSSSEVRKSIHRFPINTLHGTVFPSLVEFVHDLQYIIQYRGPQV